MNKSIIILGAIATVLLMVSSAIAVPATTQEMKKNSKETNLLEVKDKSITSDEKFNCLACMMLRAGRMAYLAIAIIGALSPPPFKAFAVFGLVAAAAAKLIIDENCRIPTIIDVPDFLSDYDNTCSLCSAN